MDPPKPGMKPGSGATYCGGGRKPDGAGELFPLPPLLKFWWLKFWFGREVYGVLLLLLLLLLLVLLLLLLL